MAVVKAPNLGIEGLSSMSQTWPPCVKTRPAGKISHTGYRFDCRRWARRQRSGSGEMKDWQSRAIRQWLPLVQVSGAIVQMFTSRVIQNISTLLSHLWLLYESMCCVFFDNYKDIPIYENLICPPIELVWFSSIDGSAILEPSKLKLSQNNFLTVVL